MRELRRRAFVLAATTGAIVGGCANDDAARTVTATVTSAQPTTATETAAPDDETGTSTTPEDPGNGLRFSGNGDARLPPFRVPRGGAVLEWTNRGEVFSLFGRQGTVVDSVAPEGRALLPAGVHRIDVVASGGWAITIGRARRVG